MICKLISDPHLSLQRLIVPAGLTRPDEWRRGRIHHLITRCSCRCSGRKPDGHDENSHPSHSFLHEGSARCQQDVSHEKITFLSSFPAEQGGTSTPSKSWGMLLKHVWFPSNILGEKGSPATRGVGKQKTKPRGERAFCWNFTSVSYTRFETRNSNLNDIANSLAPAINNDQQLLLVSGGLALHFCTRRQKQDDTSGGGCPRDSTCAVCPTELLDSPSTPAP